MNTANATNGYSLRRLFRTDFFTLIELLVVISIITILAGMLLPALSSARMTAKQVKCIGNLRQQGAGLSMYATDNTPFYPTYYNSSGTGGVSRYWEDLLAPYSNARYNAAKAPCYYGSIFDCPAYDAKSGENDCGVSDYTYCLLYWPLYPDPKSYLNNALTVKTPSISAIVADGGRNECQFTNTKIGYVNEDWSLARFLRNRHHTGLNILYCDGHVKWMKAKINDNLGSIFKYDAK